jgi:hypothetical protein
MTAENDFGGDVRQRDDVRMLRAPVTTSARVLAGASVVLICTFALVAVVEVAVVAWLIGETPPVPGAGSLDALQAPLLLLVAGAVGTVGICVLLLHLTRHWVRRSLVAAGAS